MYSNIKSVQILIALLKKYEVKNIVMSPGGSDIPIIHSIETDSYFTCYSVVDERSAMYFGMGVAQQKGVPVACICTSGTAVSNYLPGMTEAFYQNVPIVAITADKNPRYLEQLETQKINQINIFGSVCRKAVNLPVIQSNDDCWYCERLICEALSEMTHRGCGPVQINIPIIESYTIYNVNELPEVKAIRYVPPYAEGREWLAFREKLLNADKILVIVGQNVHITNILIDKMKKFFEMYNCTFAIEPLSNLLFNGCINTYPITEMCKGSLTKEMVPEIVISLGNNLSAYGLKPFLRHNSGLFEHWSVDECGRIRDVVNGLTNVFECPAEFFFDQMMASGKFNGNNKRYYNSWKNLADKINIPEFDFSNFYVAKQLAEVIPENAILHTAILNSTRIMQFFNLKPGVKCYSNIGALGIDGCMSTFMGQASCTNELAFLIIGDLSFFYDMNSAGIRHVGNNVRIVMLNNGGGSEFHFIVGRKKIPTINEYICAEHQKCAEGWVKSLGYKYYSVTNKAELSRVIPILTGDSDAPIFIEVFTDMEEEAKKTKAFYSANENKGVTSSLKHVAKAVLSDEQIERLKKAKNKMGC